jgi:Trk K+ transport system NAD-binding subunit
VIDENLPDLEEIWSVMNTLLESNGGNNAQRLKRNGASVIQGVVTPTSTLAGKTNNDVEFRNRYKAVIVAIQNGRRNVSLVGSVRFATFDKASI